MKLSYRTEYNAKAISAVYGRDIDGKAPYTIRAVSDDVAEFWIMDVLGWPWNDINAMVREVSELKSKDIDVRLNSPGGDPIDTFALYHAFKNHPKKVTFTIEAMAASAASFLPLSGDEIKAYPSSLMMVHNSWICAVGNRFDLQDIAGVLEKIDNSMRDIYAERTGIGKREISEMMKAETYMSAKEMKEKGFIDTIIDGKPVKANLDLPIFANLPEEFKADGEKKEPTIRDIEKLLREGGVSNKKAKAILANIKTTEETHNDEKLEKDQHNDVIAAIKNNIATLRLR